MVASVKRLRQAAATVEYFEADGYYARGDPEHRKASRWYGEGARHCRLHNRTVTAGRFAAILEGHVPRTGRRLGRLRDGEHQHLPGIDVTFSAPKSFSLEALLYAPPHTRARLLNAHDAAVRAALDLLERELLLTRGYDRATRRRPRVPAHGLLAATFRHVTNRNLDPQVHTHAVIANMTRNGAGEWRSAEFTAVFRAKKLLGACYRAELQRRLEAIGYATLPTVVGAMPGFEIKGYPKALLDHFSTRRRDLLAWLEARGLAYTPANAQQAVLATRRRKTEPDRAELAGIWRRRSAQCARARDPQAVRRRCRPAPPPPSPLELTRRAVEHLAERSTLFTAHDLRGYALAYGGGRQPLAAIDAAVAGLERDRLLLAVPADGAGRTFTTRGAAAAEREVLQRMRAGRRAGAALADAGAVASALAASALNAGQRAALRTVLLEPHRVVGVQGYAGTGKTTMLRAVARLAAGAPLLGLAPSTAAARVLGREAGIPTRTLQWFLVRHGDVADGTAAAAQLAAARATHGGGLLIVDEASMIGTTAMVRLLRIADRLGVARVALVGDRHQLRAIEAGQPFRLLQGAGMPTARMTEVLRQRDPSLRTAVEHLIAERPGLAIAELGGRVVEVGGGEDRDAEIAETMADLWLELDAGARGRTLLLAPTHALRAEVHDGIRRRLAVEGVLRGPTLTLERYVNLRLTRAQKRELVHYREGDVLVFHQRDYGVGVEAGDTCHVVGTDGGRVLLDPPDGRVRRMRPEGRVRYRFELYETRPIELRAGDRIRWTRPYRGDGLEFDNGARATIRAIGRRRVRFRADDGAEYALARSAPQLHHLDHAYTSTVHGAQGMTADFVIAILRADHGPLVDLKTAYVEISRARDDAVLLTDDREALGAALDLRADEEHSALAALGVDLADPERDLVPVPGAEPATALSPVVEPPRLRAAAVPWWEFAAAARARDEEPFAAAGSEAAIAPVLELAADVAGDVPAGIARVVSDHGAWHLRQERDAARARAHRERERRAAAAAEVRRHEEQRRQRVHGLAAAMRRLQAAVAGRLRAAAARQQQTDIHLLRLAWRERGKLAAWKRGRVDLAAARPVHAGPGPPTAAYDDSTAEGRRVLPLLHRLLTGREPRNLLMSVRAARHASSALARDLAAAVRYDDEAAALQERLRARRVEAGQDGVPWFAGEAGAALRAGIDELAEKAGSSELAGLVRLPARLVQARVEHRRDKRRQAAVQRLVARMPELEAARARLLDAVGRDGTWLQAHPEYPSWRKEADRVAALAEKSIAAETRYRPHVEATAPDPPSDGAGAAGPKPAPAGDRVWERFRIQAEMFRAALNRDDDARKLEETRRALFDSPDTGTPPFYREGYAAFIGEVEGLYWATWEQPGERPQALAAVFAEHRRQEALREEVTTFAFQELPALEALPARRGDLRRAPPEAGGTDFERLSHRHWLAAARKLTAKARTMLENPDYQPHLRIFRDMPERIRQALGPVQDRLEAEAVLRDWRALAGQARAWRPTGSGASSPESGRAPFFEPGYDELIERVRAVHGRTGEDEAVPEFAAALHEHERLAETQARVDQLLARIRTCTEKRRKLLERASRYPTPFQAASPRRHATWERLGAEAEEASSELLANFDTYGPHVHRNPRGWSDYSHSRFETFASQGLGGLPAAHLKRLHDHGALPPPRSDDPWLTSGLDDIVTAMEQCLPKPWDRDATPEQKRASATLQLLRRKRQIRIAPGMARGVKQERDELEAEAIRQQCAVVDLPAYADLRKDFDSVSKLFSNLVSNPDCRPSLERWPRHAEGLRDCLEKLRDWQMADDAILQERRRRAIKEKMVSHRRPRYRRRGGRSGGPRGRGRDR